MRRADRLFRIIQMLRRHSVATARRLAQALEVSERTIYRDIRDLSASGVPIESEAGVGYRLRGYDLPPLMFTREELEALVLGARLVESWSDPELARAAKDALAKVASALPGDRPAEVDSTMLFAPRWIDENIPPAPLAEIRHAIRDRHRLLFAYRDAAGKATERTVRPLGLAFFGPVWVLIAWCELRDDFRNFRPDRIVELRLLPGQFEPEPGKTYSDYLRAMEEKECR